MSSNPQVRGDELIKRMHSYLDGSTAPHYLIRDGLAEIVRLTADRDEWKGRADQLSDQREEQDVVIKKLRSYLWAIWRRAVRDDVSATDMISVLASEALNKLG